MPDDAPNPLPSRRDPLVAAVGEAWRRLTGPREDADRRTLIACSGGADSSALALALRAINPARDNLVVAHVMHDLRSADEARADRDLAEAMARRLGVPFACAQARVHAQPGNAEANARRDRYEALAQLAEEHACEFVATAHHADDQLETLLMALMRGAGVAGLRGIAPARALGERTTLIRPMLEVSRDAGERLCREAGWTWAEDATNRDESRLRAAIRARVTPILRELRPRAPERATATARIMRETQRLIERAAEDHQALADTDAHCRVWKRDDLRAEEGVVIAEILRGVAARLMWKHHGVDLGRDRLSERVIRRGVDAIRSPSGETRTFQWAHATLVVERETVTLRLRDGADNCEELDADPTRQEQARRDQDR